jgi:hypothetical protein
MNRIHLAVLGARHIVSICFLQTIDALITITEDVPPWLCLQELRIIELLIFIALSSLRPSTPLDLYAKPAGHHHDHARQGQ